MSQLLILIKDHLFTSLRTKKGMIFLFLYLAIFGLIAYGFFHIQNLMNRELDRQGISSVQRTFVTTFAENALHQTYPNEEFVNFLLDIPFINIALFIVAILGTPMLILILNYDKVSQEVYDGTIRYLLFRTSRFKIYISKYFSGIVEVALITFIAMFVALIWGSFQIRFFDFKESFGYGLRFWLIAQPFLWVFVAFSLLLSSLFKKPFHSLLFSFLGFFALILLPIWIGYVSPFDAFYMQGLFYDFSWELFQSILFFGLFSIVFLSIGYFIFNKKDL